ncbi:uncharacterized protein LAESUDRAFT_740280 [Laetiporus sulphureus 93-53]|uniref:Uncharacterized protein n=1 Tax=Laetiporus sulphureus 93-53 TaxID=1314785 RepID=A0A165IH13_9APHY|nr:uncharacterized protein LAESUDRAFT_740280 [Laetiporus sulphureus 93-53]KZT13060.1 hypothetical protein LAESUDRAFT_740280 [Laetiporus sulphureus 93-53]
MSAHTTPNSSPAHVQPLHNPSQAAHVAVPQAPLGNATNGLSNQAPGMGAKALLAKKFASQNPKFVSPTDKLMTPVSQKLNAAKKKHFARAAKPMQPLFVEKEVSSGPDRPAEEREDDLTEEKKANDDDENPF